jgi:protein phosphatase|tara:strand:- start:7266 stop:8072 length:807 start_codon:yes stop_codon:yes gene_type:complete
MNGDQMLTYFAETNIGNKRDNNEDYYLASPKINMWILADGVGGHDAGEVASQLACNTIEEKVLAGDSIADAIQLSHELIKRSPEEGVGRQGMASTIVVLKVKNDKVDFFWVGDSRGYQWNKDTGLTARTCDQSLVQQLLDKGVITEEEARVHPNRNVIIQALGQLDLEKLVVDTSSHDYVDGDLLLLCSDGLSDCVDDKKIDEIITTAENPEQAASDLVDTALANGGKDNITVIIVSLEKKKFQEVKAAKSFFQKLKSLIKKYSGTFS